MQIEAGSEPSEPIGGGDMSMSHPSTLIVDTLKAKRVESKYRILYVVTQW